MNGDMETDQTQQPKPPPVEGWPVKDVWEKYEEVAMHFNDLLIKLRTQALAAVAAISAIAGIFSKSGGNDHVSWGLAAAIFFFLCLFWIAIWVIDFRYYNRLLLGAVNAILDLELASKDKTHIRYINISTEIERAVAGEGPALPKEMHKRRRKLSRGRWAFYIIVFIALLCGLGFSIAQHEKLSIFIPMHSARVGTVSESYATHDTFP